MAEPGPPTPRRPARPAAPRHASTITRASSSQQRAIREIARRLIWWQTPDRALAQSGRFLAQVMALGTWDDIVAVRQVYGDDAFRAVLADPPPGVFDPRSWHYWYAVFGIDPVPPLPRRFETQRLTGDDRTTTTERPVVLSFFGALNLGSVGVPEVAADNDVPVASLLDLAATKVKAVVDRAEAKDYLDIAALTEVGISLADALGAARAGSARDSTKCFP